uniref:G-protein coupled receptors family 3 profile domain-containing protein n=1 Tax=Mucochytrium quahogii TaxID=96639 RepID=A0A7S2S9F8_9STRA|mmetsp:Transcript_9389/g.15320  ORF Transcript_9389/g.15320 Transcript_9389/m.15320 type:complete len:357 (+) Transcript_9389:291-1361(+)
MGDGSVVYTLPDDIIQCQTYSNGTQTCFNREYCYVQDPGASDYVVGGHVVNFDQSIAVGMGFVSISVLGCLFATAFLFYNRNRPVILMSQYRMLMLFVWSLLLLNIAVFCQLLSFADFFVNACAVYFYLNFAATTAILMILGLKTWRAHLLFVGTQKLQKMKFPDYYIYAVVGAVELVILIICIAWFVTDKPIPNPCESLNCPVKSGFVTAFGAWTFLLTVVATIVAFIARNVPSIASESKGILFSALIVLIGVIIVLILFYATPLKESQKAMTFCIFTTCVTIFSLFALIFIKYKSLGLTREEVNSRFLTPSLYSTPTISKRSLNQSPVLEANVTIAPSSTSPSDVDATTQVSQV